MTTSVEPQIPLTIYTESTPNPESMKFVMNRMISHTVVEIRSMQEAIISPLAQELFAFPFIKNVFYSNNFVTITKTLDTDWDEVIMEIKEFIKAYVLAEKPILTGLATPSSDADGNDSDAVKQIKNILDTYVKPAVEMDGGNIIFRSYEDGIVTLGMQGSCSGCPSSTVTLKSGIEGLMKRMMPEVKEVVAEAM
jgi:Fe-S cluster biogenesis protein NfuA